MIILALTKLLCTATLVSLVSAHGDHSQAQLADTHDWATKHMAEEHHIQGFDATTFFRIHLFSSSGSWTKPDIRRMYGLYDKSTDHVDEQTKDFAAQQILGIYDANHDGEISLEEFLAVFEGKGTRLPDLGFGPGHHGDEEYEYEIHHWEKYHDENTKEEDLNHPEDIAHFKMHEEQEQREEINRKLGMYEIVEENIPEKFRRNWS